MNSSQRQILSFNSVFNCLYTGCWKKWSLIQCTSVHCTLDAVLEKVEFIKIKSYFFKETYCFHIGLYEKSHFNGLILSVSLDISAKIAGNIDVF